MFHRLYIQIIFLIMEVPENGGPSKSSILTECSMKKTCMFPFLMGETSTLVSVRELHAGHWNAAGVTVGTYVLQNRRKPEGVFLKMMVSFLLSCLSCHVLFIVWDWSLITSPWRSCYTPIAGCYGCTSPKNLVFGGFDPAPTVRICSSFGRCSYLLVPYNRPWKIHMARHKIYHVQGILVYWWNFCLHGNANRVESRWAESEIPTGRHTYVQATFSGDIHVGGSAISISKVENWMQTTRHEALWYVSKKCRAEPRRMGNRISPKKGCTSKSNSSKAHFPMKIAIASGLRTQCFHKRDMNSICINKSFNLTQHMIPGPKAAHQTWSFQAPHLWWWGHLASQNSPQTKVDAKTLISGTKNQIHRTSQGFPRYLVWSLGNLTPRHRVPE